MIFCSRTGSVSRTFAHAIAHFGLFEQPVRRERFARHEHGRQRRAVNRFEVRHRGRGLDRGDAENRALETRDVGAHALGQVGQRRLGAEFAAQLFARGLEFAADAADATRPRIAAQRVNHRASHPAFGERLEFDAAAFVKPVRASMRPMTPSCTKSPRSIECGMVDAMRRANDSTNGKLAAIRSCWWAAKGARISNLLARNCPGTITFATAMPGEIRTKYETPSERGLGNKTLKIKGLCYGVGL
jgi:hypothetical protein